MSKLPITACTEADFLQIMGSIDQFWEGGRSGPLHNRLFLSEFGDSAYVIREGAVVVAYLFGLIGTAEPRTGYIHLVAVRQSHRGRGLARRLYQAFEGYAQRNDCSRLKAVTSLGNAASIEFHKGFGMNAQVIEHYAGPNDEHHRMVFTKTI